MPDKNFSPPRYDRSTKGTSGIPGGARPASGAIQGHDSSGVDTAKVVRDQLPKGQRPKAGKGVGKR